MAVLRTLRTLTCGVVVPFLCGGCLDPRVSRPSSDPAADGTGGAGGAGFVEQGPWEECHRQDGKRCIPDHVLARRGVAYSGYRGNQSPKVEVYPTADEIQEDLRLLAAGGWSFIRLFDSGPHGETVLRVIAENGLDIKVQLGIWIDGPKATKDGANRDQIERGVVLASTYPSTVVAVSVGNEVLDDWSSVRTPPGDLAEYIREVRERVVQPVATDDMYPPFLMQGAYADVLRVVEEVDYLSLHAYAFLDAPYGTWDFVQQGSPAGLERATAMMDAAVDYTKAVVTNVRAALAAKGLELPILIGEAGWKSVSTKTTEATERGLAHPVNQQMFYERMADWIYGAGKDADSPGSLLYFSAFDEPWKGIDDGWGLFDVNRNPKYVVWASAPERKPPDAPEYSEADAVYFEQ